jgi:hypothetical protein
MAGGRQTDGTGNCLHVADPCVSVISRTARGPWDERTFRVVPASLAQVAPVDEPLDCVSGPSPAAQLPDSFGTVQACPVG